MDGIGNGGKRLTNFKLNNQQHVLLTLITRHTAHSPTGLAEEMNITKSAVSQQLAKLEKGGYKKKKFTRDKRSYSAVVKGIIYKKEMDAFQQQILDLYSSKLSYEE